MKFRILCERLLLGISNSLSWVATAIRPNPTRTISTYQESSTPPRSQNHRELFLLQTMWPSTQYDFHLTAIWAETLEKVGRVEDRLDSARETHYKRAPLWSRF